jgi:hypothetical protein
MKVSVRLAVLFIFFLAKMSNLTAQESRPVNPGRSFKVSLMDAIDPFSPAFMLSYEQPFAEFYSVQAEGGFISTFGGKWVQEEPIGGFKTRLEIRKYWPFTAPKDFVYIGLQGMYKKMRYPSENDVFCRDGCNYFQWFNFREENNAYAGHLSLGLIFFAGQHIIIDLGGFGGLRVNHRRYVGVPDDATRRFTRIFRQPGTFAYPSLGVAMKIGFAW